MERPHSRHPKALHPIQQNIIDDHRHSRADNITLLIVIIEPIFRWLFEPTEYATVLRHLVFDNRENGIYSRVC
jgi:hypothetical protein